MTDVVPRELMVVKRGWRANDRHDLFAAVRHHKFGFKMHVRAEVGGPGQTHKLPQSHCFEHHIGRTNIFWPYSLYKVVHATCCS